MGCFWNLRSPSPLPSPPGRGRTVSSAGNSSPVSEFSWRAYWWFPLLGERVRVRANLNTIRIFSTKGISFIVVALVLFACLPGRAAETKSWVMLTNCQYVMHKDNDGDSFRVRSGTNEFNLRLYFVDAPEPDLHYPDRTREQSDHFGVSSADTVKAGFTARDIVREILQQPFVVWTRKARAPGRSNEPRFYGLVDVGNKSLAEMLVSKGLARPKGVPANLPSGEKSKAYKQKLLAMENEAREKKIGLWANSKQAATDKPDK